jgi:hypothetical protein
MMTPGQARAAGYTVTKVRALIGPARPSWHIATNINHPSGRSGQRVGAAWLTREEALEEVEHRIGLDRGTP